MQNKQKWLVSTLICTYNAEKFFRWTIESVLDQTYKNQEILIRDDGSTDNTINIIKEYQEQDNRIKLWTSKDLGKKLWPYGGLNFLIDKSLGEFIAIQDHDDIWHPEKLEKQVKFLNENEDYVWCGTETLMYFWKSKVWYFTNDWNKKTTRVIHTSLVFRNKWLKYNLEQYYLADGFFMHNILTKWKKILFVLPEILTLHYYKETWWNLSEQWWWLSFKKFKRYFEVYWFSIFNLINNLYLTFKWVLIPYKVQKWITFNISLKKKLKNLSELEKNENSKKMLSYLYK